MTGPKYYAEFVVSSLAVVKILILELHGDGDDGNTVECTTVMGLNIMTKHRDNCVHGDSIHGSTTGVVTELEVKPP